MSESVQNKNKLAKSVRTEIEGIRIACRYDKRMFAHILGLPYRTYQDYAYAISPTPEKVMEKAKKAHEREMEIMEIIKAEIKENIDRLYPNGIPSEVKE